MPSCRGGWHAWTRPNCSTPRRSDATAGASGFVAMRTNLNGTRDVWRYSFDASLAPFEALLPAGIEVVEHRPQGAVGNPPQDLWVLRRAEGPGLL